MKTIVLPVLLIVIGTGWLLTALKVMPDVDWVWTLGLGAIGLLTFVACGFDKFSFVVGLFFLVASFLSILRQTGRLYHEVEAPILVITVGALLLLAHLPFISNPKWILDAKESQPKT